LAVVACLFSADMTSNPRLACADSALPGAHGRRIARGTDHHGGYTPLSCAVSCRSIQGAS
ncbi:uncharacterized protein METZ01_LOCUS340177, partial [marine metagenome]